jgi:hypothetical protein
MDEPVPYAPTDKTLLLSARLRIEELEHILRTSTVPAWTCTTMSVVWTVCRRQTNGSSSAHR